LMGGAALVLMLLTRGSVHFLVVLYSINVFITFSLSQLGMVRHWWKERKSGQPWRKNIFIPGFGLVLTLFILLSVIVLKFNEGGWITLFITGGLVGLALFIRHHYDRTSQLLKRLDDLVLVADAEIRQTTRHAGNGIRKTRPKYDPTAKTAILLVNGFTGFGLHTLFNIILLFGSTFKNFIFIQIAIVDAGVFRGVGEVKELGTKVKRDLNRYVEFVNGHGYYGEEFSSTDIDVIGGVTELTHKIMKRFPNAVLFGGQLVFPKETFLTRMLHNYTIFSIQRKLYHEGIPVVILPIRVT
jgi:amino acid transporter